MHLAPCGGKCSPQHLPRAQLRGVAQLHQGVVLQAVPHLHIGGQQCNTGVSPHELRKPWDGGSACTCSQRAAHCGEHSFRALCCKLHKGS